MYNYFCSVVLNFVKIWVAGALSRTEERHHSVARVREQLNGSAGAPGGAHRESGAHVAVRNQRVESLQRVRDKRTSQPDARCVWKLSANSFFSPPLFPTFSNLAFMIEMAQKELQKLRWHIHRTFGFKRVLERSFHVYQCCVVVAQETNPRPKLAEEERSVGRRSQTARAWIKVGFWWFYSVCDFSSI